MTQGDFETFYPFQAGIGKGAPNNFESGYSYSYESSMDGDEEGLDDSKDDQENTEYEGEAQEAGGDVQNSPKLGCFIKNVIAKKKELKAQYGKGSFDLSKITNCGVMPIRANYNPFIIVDEIRTCVGWEPSCDKKCLGICCGSMKCVNYSVIPGNRQAFENATARFDSDKARWVECQKVNGPWKPGWRREWRKFKRSGGLKTLLDQCSTGAAGVTPATEPVPPRLSRGVIKRGLTAKGVLTDARGGEIPSESTARESSSKTNSYIVPIIIAVVLLVGGFYIYKTLKK